MRPSAVGRFERLSYLKHGLEAFGINASLGLDEKSVPGLRDCRVKERYGQSWIEVDRL